MLALHHAWQSVLVLLMQQPVAMCLLLGIVRVFVQMPGLGVAV
jgi:hypothetical protein